jgi:hypothetical protein
VRCHKHIHTLHTQLSTHTHTRTHTRVHRDSQVSELVLSIFIGLADLIINGITYSRLQSGTVAVPNEGYKAAYTTALCFGVVTTVLSLGYRLRNARLVRAYVLKQGQQGRAVSVSEARRHAQQHEWELAQTHRTKVVASLALLSVAAQGKATNLTVTLCTQGCITTIVGLSSHAGMHVRTV